MKRYITPIAMLIVVLGLCVVAKAAENERQRPGPEAQQAVDRERAAKQIEELEIKIGNLVREQQFDKAAALYRELNELKARQGKAELPSLSPPVRRGPDDLERRLMHARVAIGNLHEAGMHEQAERIQQDVDRMTREFREQAERRAMAERREHEARQRAERERREGPRTGGDPRIEALADQINQMRREIQELREMVKHLAERDRR
jgi:hypothetical protein